MKLRRALAAAATTAVIAPIALLSAPAAFATDDTATPSASESTPAAGPSTPAADESTPAAGESTPAADESAPGAGESTPAADESTPAAGESTPAAGESDPAEEPLPFCEEVDETFAEEALATEVSALPGKIVAGSGWHGFTLKVTNTSDVTLKDVAFYAEVESTGYWETGKPVLSPYVDLQFKNPSTKSWEDVEGEDGLAGGYFWGTDTMKPGDFNRIELRVNVRKGAPAGESYHFGTGAYIDNVNGEDCVAEGFGDGWFFDVLPAGSSNENPGEAAPGPEKPSAGAPEKPQGGVGRQPVTGSLAETGAGSNMPALATIGGIAVFAGAGVMFAVKRRRGGAEA
ncbi:integral membrane protein [Streptomyces zinciresistens K42]|uniref:Integral membrane protein n=1 Tax=Streptomyces zinciresistens K42 TaxID=700597 RepID=G2GJC4_9ACTN|nr:LPXTG cell wall anchor domain-containing protein [Streptomyces zinciresistens]EGX56389.1 integral membrane protein [Streptomyces zinciresistens K42]